MLTLIDERDTRLTFDPIDVDDRLPSVEFLIRLTRTANSQSCTVEHCCWFYHDALNRFESELTGFIDGLNAFVCLSDLSQRPKIEFERNGKDVLFRFHAVENSEQAKALVTIAMDLNGVREIRRRISEYPKWW